MDVFGLRDQLVRDYEDYTRSFLEISDPRIKERVESAAISSKPVSRALGPTGLG